MPESFAVLLLLFLLLLLHPPPAAAAPPHPVGMAQGAAPHAQQRHQQPCAAQRVLGDGIRRATGQCRVRSTGRHGTLGLVDLMMQY